LSSTGVVREVVDALLSNPRLKLEAVALSVGFADGAALGKAVRRWTGCSPAAYRKRLVGASQRA
jgi:AraC-like DNA-binding protein